jgi:hypothetical protein
LNRFDRADRVLDRFLIDFGRSTPKPPLFVNVPGTALDGVYGTPWANRAAASA